MIIIDQNKKGIVNFDNIVIVEVHEYNNSITLEALVKENWIELGKHKSEERAKEVLQEIIKFYTRLDLKEQEVPVDKAIAITLMRDKAAFEMPAE